MDESLTFDISSESTSELERLRSQADEQIGKIDSDASRRWTEELKKSISDFHSSLHRYYVSHTEVTPDMKDRRKFFSKISHFGVNKVDKEVMLRLQGRISLLNDMCVALIVDDKISKEGFNRDDLDPQRDEVVKNLDIVNRRFSMLDVLTCGDIEPKARWLKEYTESEKAPTAKYGPEEYDPFLERTGSEAGGTPSGQHKTLRNAASKISLLVSTMYEMPQNGKKDALRHDAETRFAVDLVVSLNSAVGRRG